MQRRDFLKAATALSAYALPISPLLAALDQRLMTTGEKVSFDYAWLKGFARHLSGQPHQDHEGELPDQLKSLSWDDYQAIGYRADHALWSNSDAPYTAQLFHLGRGFTTPVRIYQVSQGQAQELAYDPALFNFSNGDGDSVVDTDTLSERLGFAGFRLHHHQDPKRDIASFLGASYFRAVSQSMQYGMSARGLAIDTAGSEPEEFPDFTRFWLEQPEGEDKLIVYALLESESTTGAYRFDIRRDVEGVVMDVAATLYPRKTIERLGIAPLTSMYLVGENDRDVNYDWRPEIHDSDGLSIHTESGEWLWRPLVNPPQLRYNAYSATNVQGFGLAQRDHDFDHYQDDGVYYDRRPSVWVEPTEGWGEGSVDLVELPAKDETFDNIVAYWQPKTPVEAGQELRYAYRLSWYDLPPQQPSLSRCVATRTGLGGVVGQRREYFSWRFAVDFRGGPFPFDDASEVEVEPVIETSAGRIEITSARPLDAIQGYRAMFDVVPPDEGTEPINLRLYLRDSEGKPLSETWIYQWTPPPGDERELHNPDHL
ncbi:glucan biosynthesis protein D [Halomonas litopenaei]|uniref:Glucan biosynthesis protein D n=1 Tax=Halomonas litopenaei TaxID=2109328 RepID=A0ABX5IRE8_9GAMM|nr:MULTISPECIES: glucan biosynthesis protein D [Halomonas]MBS8269273.1 glucan biosynthesis protein D [Halomonas litopenaei]PTL89086.1 glucan biosynthesis protein D [Halomonas litopenaei]PTL89362.1 glucan biosynthesis protein D [Halomonas sp. SYSU XM8]